jgi:hypothetical protein
MSPEGGVPGPLGADGVVSKSATTFLASEGDRPALRRFQGRRRLLRLVTAGGSDEDGRLINLLFAA